MTTEIDNKEYKLIELNIPKKGLMKAGVGLVMIDGAYHILEGLGMFTPVPGAESMMMSEFVAASQAVAINWFAITYGILLVLIGIMLWRYINSN